jgi:hypothetical protein
MFLVELEPGQRCHYTTARALGQAIRRGQLGPQARIFHQTADQWLSITVHPEYRKAEAEWDEVGARRLRAQRWTFFPRVPEEPAAAEETLAPSTAPIGLLMPGEPETRWFEMSRFRSAFRHVLQLARPGI